MNRIDQAFKKLKKRKEKAFIAFITAGYPNLHVTEQLVLSFEKAGVDIVELGVPFSDPLADGKTIQAASQQALQHHITLEKIFQMVKRIRTRSQIPIALMTYYNPVFHLGEEKFMARAKSVGVDGVIVPDLPPEEAASLSKLARKKSIATVFFLSPTTTPSRMKKIVDASTGFIYYVSVTGITGTSQTILAQQIKKQVTAARRLTAKPVCVGFGVSDARQVKAVARLADGVIVGSAIIRAIAKNKGKKNLIQNVSRFVAQLAKAV
ncbi:MAG: tryptophan synthase subunit alpha [Omnitrophica WOR_2 bacterium RIFCSPHIGHO2_02_FULL_48_11]|nr:MAG: tryptophan synthase subunit alpha [Omnitrophica WOR_2 bacterium RIFCSPHIGHO2_02_FULL_48_11]